jgi:hypothetical protein
MRLSQNAAANVEHRQRLASEKKLVTPTGQSLCTRRLSFNWIRAYEKHEQHSGVIFSGTED